MSLVLLGSTSGSVTLQEPAIAGSTTIDLPATSGTMAVLPTATSVLPQASGGTGTTTGYYGFKNRIINGAMVISQRGTSAFTQTTSVTYSLDRWGIYGSGGSQFTAQQLSATPPAGFKNYLGVVNSATPVTPSGAQEWDVFQYIEGFNTADLGWGTAGAATVTLSFWVRSSVTGSFGGQISNYNATRSYPFSYTISAANTWEQKTITVAGDTTGTWNTDNTIGVGILFSLGAGSTKSGTANTWAGANYVQPTGSVALVATASATWQVTGVQLEKGSTATSFDYRPYGTELALCQRYYYQVATYGPQALGTGFVYSATEIDMTLTLPVAMRSTPSISQTTGSNYYTLAGAANKAFTGFSGSQNFSGNTVNLYVTGLSGMTGGQAGMVVTTAAGASLGLTAEL